MEINNISQTLSTPEKLDEALQNTLNSGKPLL